MQWGIRMLQVPVAMNHVKPASYLPAMLSIVPELVAAPQNSIQEHSQKMQKDHQKTCRVSLFGLVDVMSICMCIYTNNHLHCK